MRTKEFPKATTVCPHANHCQHHATSVIGPSGICPDCGTQVYRVRAANPGRKAHGAGAFLSMQRKYDGGWLD